MGVNVKTKTVGSKRKSVGAAGIEYMLLLMMVALVMAGFLLSVKTSTGKMWNNAATQLSSVFDSGSGGDGGNGNGNGGNGNGGNGNGHHHGGGG